MRGIPEILLRRIVTFLWSFGANPLAVVVLLSIVDDC